MGDQIWRLGAQQGFAAAEVDLATAQRGQFGHDRLEAGAGQGRLAGRAPVIAHLALEIAAVVELDLDVERPVGSLCGDCVAETI